MNRYPVWKNTLIALVIALGVLYALPNIYGKDPAVQMTSDSLDISIVKEVEAALKGAEIETKSISFENEELIVRFNNLDDQRSAKELLTTNYIDQRLPGGTKYSVAMNLVPTTPEWLKALNAKQMSLGLDLQGGVHFLMEVDLPVAQRQAREAYVSEIRTLLRKESIRYKNIALTAKGIRLELKNTEDKDAAYDIIANQLTDALIDDDSSSQVTLIVSMSQAKMEELNASAMAQNIETLRNRVDEMGVSEPVVQQQGLDRIVVELPGVQDPTKVKEIMKTTATLEYRLVDEKNDAYSASQTGRIPPGSRLYFDKRGTPILLSKRLIVSGRELIDAAQGIDPQDGSPMVSVQLNGAGGSRMRNVTTENVGNRLAVVFVESEIVKKVLDNGEVKKTRKYTEQVINNAVIREPFGNRFQTTGLESAEKARDLALLLRAGALAAPIEIIEERTVGPSLGEASIEKGFQSVIIGFVLVLIFMVVYYRVFGFIANLALFFNLVVVVALLSLLGATLTLPGIAGLVLTIGMAVDANVLIFERIREELSIGNTPQASIKAGYEKAFSTIADANITTLIAAVVLFSVGTGPIKGFAITLSLGIITSMFTAILGTRAIVNLFYGGKKRLKSLAI